MKKSATKKTNKDQSVEIVRNRRNYASKIESATPSRNSVKWSVSKELAQALRARGSAPSSEVGVGLAL